MGNPNPQNPADIVDVLNTLSLKEAAGMLASLPHQDVVEIFDHPELWAAAELLGQLPPASAAKLLGDMSADRAARLLRNTEDAVREQLFGLVGVEASALLRQLLSYPIDTAGSLMTTEFVAVPASWTVGATLQHIRQVEPTRETIYAIYVLDPGNGRLLHTTSLRNLITGNTEESILTVASDRPPVLVVPSADREDVARLIAKHDLLALPVVDDAGKMLGIVTVDDMMDVLVAESAEDVQKFGGMQAIERRYMDVKFFQMFKKRGGWLAALFLGEMLTASAMQHFEDDIANAVVLTLFIPLIMSSGGNSGSQATSLIIRGLALQELRPAHWWRVALRELPAGAALGTLLGLIGALRITIWQIAGFYDYGEHWQLIALTIGASLIAIVTFGSMTGALLPFGLRALNFDPAVASAPLVATIVDVSGIVIYFSIAVLVLTGTVL